jgi:hypothetical protein
MEKLPSLVPTTPPELPIVPEAATVGRGAPPPDPFLEDLRSDFVFFKLRDDDEISGSSSATKLLLGVVFTFNALQETGRTRKRMTVDRLLIFMV